MMRMKILHLITGLDVGGAEMMLLNLLKQGSFASSTSRVVSLTGIGVLGKRIQQLGIEVIPLGMKPGRPDIRGFWRFVRLLRQDPPDLVQTWMYHADLLGALAAVITGNIPVVWGVHHTLDGKQPVSKATLRVLRLNAFLSRWLPRRVLCCAESARQAHIKVGFASEKMIVIPNGIDIQEFHPDPKAHSDVCRELNLDPGTQVIGMFARFHPQKDHQTFARAAGLLHASMPDVHFLLAGDGITPANQSLEACFQAAGVLDRVHLLGLRNDMPRLMAAVTISSLSSAYGEALPLVVAESMACGIPCVVTDIGDSRLLVGNTGRIVPPGDPTALAKAWEEILKLFPLAASALGQDARAKISVGYNIVPVSERYTSLYQSILTDNNEKNAASSAPL